MEKPLLYSQELGFIFENPNTKNRMKSLIIQPGTRVYFENLYTQKKYKNPLLYSQELGFIFEINCPKQYGKTLIIQPGTRVYF